MSIINRDFPRPAADLVEAFRNITPATAHEAFGGGALHSAIKPIWPGLRLVGTAVTVRTRPADNLTIHAALKLAKPGDVVVVDADDYTEQGSFGDLMATAAKAAGIAGLVTNGSVRDIAVIREIGFPIFSQGVSVKGTTKAHLGDVNVPVSVGGVLVNPGDLVLGDDDGVVVIPQEALATTLETARAREAKEDRIRGEFEKGRIPWDVGNYNELLRKLGLDIQL